jgi:phage terminase Nu1 subunit (DNA packaging protein)
MKSFTEMLAEIDSGHATMADVESYIAEMEAVRDKEDAKRKAESERVARAHAELTRKRAIENGLHGRSRISYALSFRSQVRLSPRAKSSS